MQKSTLSNIKSEKDKEILQSNYRRDIVQKEEICLEKQRMIKLFWKIR